MRLTRTRVVGLLFSLLLALLVGVAFTGREGFGARASGDRLARMQRSKNWRDGHFVNPQPLRNDAVGMLKGWWSKSAETSPASPLEIAPVAPAMLATPPDSGLRVTWFGHSSSLVELDGARVLIDPVWSPRVSPFTWAGPTRFFEPLISLENLGPIDAVVVSHDHYDHLDHRTIVAMKSWHNLFIVPLGIGAHLEAWGIEPARIVELDWWEHRDVAGIDIVCVPARHASGRMLIDQDATLWAGYALVGPRHRAYYSGDTGLFPAMRDIGEKFGPFDVTMIESGQYHSSWPDWHIGPEQAVTAHRLVRGKVMLPVHWGLFALAYHGWTEPPERVVAEAERVHSAVVLPKPGEPIDPLAGDSPHKWWPLVPFQTAAQAPIVSTQIDEILQ